MSESDVRPRVDLTKSVCVRVPPNYPAAIAEAATRLDMTAAAWLRQTIRQGILATVSEKAVERAADDKAAA